MKKILVVLMVLVLLASTSVVANAETFVDSTQGSFVGETEFDYHVYSYFFVTIPTHIDAGSYGEFAVTMDYIEDGYHIDAYITNLDENGYVTVYSDNYNTNNVTAKIAVVKDVGDELHECNVGADGLFGTYYPTDYSPNQLASTNIGFTNAMVDNILPGGYHGVLCFRVECTHD